MGTKNRVHGKELEANLNNSGYFTKSKHARKKQDYFKNCWKINCSETSHGEPNYITQ